LCRSKQNAIALSSIIKKNPLDNTDLKYHVNRVLDNQVSTVDFQGGLRFKGNVIVLPVCDCAFFTSTRIICECICSVAHMIGYNIDDPKNIYPYWLVYNHPRWGDACKSKRLSPLYDYMPNYDPPLSSKQGVLDMSESASCAEDPMVQLNSKVYDKLGDMFHVAQNERVMKLRDAFEKMSVVAIKSPQKFKHALSHLVSLESFLSSMQDGDHHSIVRMNAIEKSRGRHAKAHLENKSALKIVTNQLAIKVMNSTFNTSKDGSTNKRKRTTSCLTCKDHFKEPASVYMGHRSNSSKCPHYIKNLQP
jgi:hypothetical protein